ncbi:hypothetical protein CH371_20215 [Leptospira wolffii]|uniref:DUF4238 domain-containing protein n=1 Tax=Leptospira wolffii TaxID=409998 RepID=A0A2M9Z6I2_9LEPT|nr:DUF4238 domain-containing protein [Leptospira wolffii]PJZ64046.1 hypothetical protein CH371_20215 [Leptospira wolffii]
MVSESKKHHYIPRFYLNSFSSGSSKKIWRYYKTLQGKIVVDAVSSKSTGYQYHINSLKFTENIEKYGPDYPEREVFQKIDDYASQVYRKLLKGGKSSLSTNEISTWSVFLHSILERSP